MAGVFWAKRQDFFSFRLFFFFCQFLAVLLLLPFSFGTELLYRFPRLSDLVVVVRHARRRRKKKRLEGPSDDERMESPRVLSGKAVWEWSNTTKPVLLVEMKMMSLFKTLTRLTTVTPPWMMICDGNILLTTNPLCRDGTRLTQWEGACTVILNNVIIKAARSRCSSPSGRPMFNFFFDLLRFS